MLDRNLGFMKKSPDSNPLISGKIKYKDKLLVLGSRGSGLGLRDSEFALPVSGSRIRVSDSRIQDSGFGIRLSGVGGRKFAGHFVGEGSKVTGKCHFWRWLGCRVKGVGCRVQGVGCRVWVKGVGHLRRRHRFASCIPG